jgi:hypothetical protein
MVRKSNKSNVSDTMGYNPQYSNQYIPAVAHQPHEQHIGIKGGSFAGGMHHHFHHVVPHDYKGDGLFDKIGDAFKSIPHNVEHTFAPVIHKGEQVIVPVVNKVGKVAVPVANKVGKYAKNQLPSDLIHKALPAVISGATGAVVSTATGNPVLGFAVGQTAGKYAGNKAGDALGDATGRGFHKFKKGSEEAKAYMQHVRAKRGKK